MSKRVSVTRQTPTGRNQGFRDNHTGKTMSRSEFVKKIEEGQYSNYHVRNTNGVKTPCSNPDNSTNNNLN